MQYEINLKVDIKYLQRQHVTKIEPLVEVHRSKLGKVNKELVSTKKNSHEIAVEVVVVEARSIRLHVAKMSLKGHPYFLLHRRSCKGATMFDVCYHLLGNSEADTN